MKKLLFTALLIASAITFSFSSTPNAGEQQQTAAASTYSSYKYIDYYVGNLYGLWPTFTVNYAGQYLGTEGYVTRRGGGDYTFSIVDSPGMSGYACYGYVVTMQNGQVVIYKIYANYTE